MANPQDALTDPFAAWRDWVSQSERQWNTFLNNAMATEEFAASMGRFMDVYLNVQKNVNDVMGRYFTSVNIPTRQDILGLGQRLSDIEGRLDAIERALTALTASLKAGATPAAAEAATAPAAAYPRPPRTKKPA